MSGIDWVTFGPAVGSAGIAFVAAGVAVWQASEARKARVDATYEAQRSADSAARSAHAAEEANALTRQQIEAAKPPEVDWRIDPLGSGTYALRNIGTKTAVNAGIETARLEYPHLVRVIHGGGCSILRNRSITIEIIEEAELPRPAELWVTWDGDPVGIAVPVPAPL